MAEDLSQTDAERRRVLVVEDEPFIAMLIEDILADMGHVTVGPVARLTPALKLASEEAIDFAILDVNLADERSFPVADILRSRAIPFVFATGYGAEGLAEGYRDEPTIPKPFDPDHLASMITRATVRPAAPAG